MAEAVPEFLYLIFQGLALLGSIRSVDCLVPGGLFHPSRVNLVI